MTATRTRRWVSDVLVAAAASLLLLVLIVGVPVALWHWIGWPLPHRWPSVSRAKAAVTAPFTDRTLLDVLACLCWLCWAIFAIDVARVAPDTIRRPAADSLIVRRGRVGPLRVAAAVLIGAIATGLLGPRVASTAASAVANGHATAGIGDAAAFTRTPTAELDARPVVDTVTVRAPRDGVHDSLWSIAQRTLGDGERWPEIYRLNRGRPQRDGASLTSPSLIRPGWILLLPAPESNTPTTPNQPTPPHRADHPTQPPTDTPPPSHTAPAHAASSANSRTHENTSRDAAADHGIDIGDGVYVSLGLAAAISGALVTARRRQRRWYIPGSGRRDDLLPVAPVIRSLNLAYLRESPETMVDGDDESDAEDHPRQSALIATVPGGPATALRTVDLSSVDARHGLGLVGPGAVSAARALLLDVLAANRTSDGHRAHVLVPRADAIDLLDLRAATTEQAGIRIIDDLDSALDQIDAALLHRARLTIDSHDGQSDEAFADIVLITSPPGHQGRLQAVLDLGASLGLIAFVLGQWRSGTSCYLEHDGTITATNHPNAQHLAGARAFTLTASAAHNLLNVLGHSRTGDAKNGGPPAAADTTPPPRNEDALKPASKSAVLPRPHGEPNVVTAADSTSGHDAAPATRGQDPSPVAELRAGDQAIQVHPATVQLTVFGTLHLHWISPGGDAMDLAATLGKRQRELLVLLALHPDGLERARVADTLWPDSPPDRPFNSLHTTLSRTRRSLAIATAGTLTDLVRTSGDRYLLDRDVVDVDYWSFHAAMAQRRTATNSSDRARACRRIVACYRGELAASVASEWIETVREAARRDALDAATELARAVVDSDPQQALNLLETACEFDPLNEQIYCSIMRTQRRLGRGDAIGRTVSLLTARLAEIGEAPARETLLLAETLQRRPATEPAASRPVGR